MWEESANIEEYEVVLYHSKRLKNAVEYYMRTMLVVTDCMLVQELEFRVL
jgi:hypothetical protein